MEASRPGSGTRSRPTSATRAEPSLDGPRSGPSPIPRPTSAKRPISASRPQSGRRISNAQPLVNEPEESERSQHDGDQSESDDEATVNAIIQERRLREQKFRNKIQNLRREVEKPMSRHVSESFDQDVEDDVLMIGAISIQDAHEQEQNLERQRLEEEVQRQERLRMDLENVEVQERTARLRLMGEAKRMDQQAQEREKSRIEQDKIRSEKLGKAFRRAEDQLKSVLKVRQGEVQALYGDLVSADGTSGAVKGRRWQVDWALSPQPVQIKVSLIRALKDRVPRGRYVLLVSLYDRLGGTALRWSKLKGQEWAGATLATRHEGRFYDREVNFNQNLYTVLPPQPNLNPGMVYVFELFLLKGAASPLDRVVAWGAFPAVSAEFQAATGKFKVPMLRGEVDVTVDSHAKFERIYSRSLDHWLGNLYFEAKALPRYTAGQKEHEIELQYSSKLMGFPERDGNSDDDTEETHLLREESSAPILDLDGVDVDGLGITTREYEPAGDSIFETHLSVPKTKNLALKSKPLTEAQRLESHTFSLGMDQLRISPHKQARLKVEFLRRQLRAEIGLSQWRTLEFWAIIVMLGLIVFLRMVTHYLGMYAFLWMTEVPIGEFSFDYYHFILEYGADVLSIEYEVGMTAAGTLFNILILVGLILIAVLSQVMMHTFFEAGSKFILGWSLVVVCDPLLILAGDIIARNWEGDAFKLYNRFDEREGNGAPGVFLTIFIFLFLIMFSLFILYQYFLKIHLDGRLLDVYRRLYGGQSAFFIPHDTEVSVSELRYICEKAERWRGESGARRKVAVWDYDSTDPEDETYHEITTHLSIFTLGIDGTKELYRQFIRLPEGAIMEVFGDHKALGSAEYTALARVLRATANAGTVDSFLRRGE